MKEYIEYIKSLKINDLDENLTKFESNQISFEKLQLEVAKNGGFSMKIFEFDQKVKKINKRSKILVIKK